MIKLNKFVSVLVCCRINIYAIYWQNLFDLNPGGTFWATKLKIHSITYM